MDAKKLVIGSKYELTKQFGTGKVTVIYRGRMPSTNNHRFEVPDGDDRYLSTVEVSKRVSTS